MENVKCKISFIVPIYDVELYLRKCVDSLLHQDYEDYEIILVDDGSPDKCPSICDEYATRFDKIRVIHQENRGLSGARNTGINAARGEYICFVDSDDYWEENVLGTLMKQIEQNNLDVLRFNYRNVDELNVERQLILNPWGRIIYSEELSSGLDFLDNRLGYACYVWQFIVRGELLRCDRTTTPMELTFTEGVLFEDVDWTPRMLSRAKRVADTKQIVYNYMIRHTGITQSRSIEKIHREIRDKITLIRKLNQWYEVNPIRWYRGMQAILVVSILKLLGRYLYEDRNEVLKLLDALRVFPIDAYHMRKKVTRCIRIINVCPRLFVWLQYQR